ncbi:MAG: hypothetical protein IIV44_00385 [Rikenellaceae bacterium]|jgi:hypothetical protein|nr:hypothetical protein [Rikenellaceae bacterium]MBQ2019894.1 hypothetical protein [Rikenellaceae bacterium]MBQ5678367.1 hypothetical protein [Rikenellaceae bacterium]
MKFLRYALMSLVAAAGLISCAEIVEIDMDEKEQQSLDAWIAKHVNNKGTRAVRQSNGLWVEIADYGDTKSMATNDTVTWVKYNFTMRDMTGNVVFTRYEDIAKWQGTYTKHTHYVPDYIFCGEYPANLLEGTHYVMRNTLTNHDNTKFNMHAGTKGTLYIPSSLAHGATGTSNDAGYGGQYSLNGSVPSIIDFEIVHVTKDPVKDEEKEVADFIASTGNWKPVNDTLDYLYVDKKFRLPEGEEAYKGDSIKIDSTVKIWYVGKFLDGFVFDTNIDSIKRRAFGKIESVGEALEFTAKEQGKSTDESGDDNSSYIKAWNYTIPHLLKGQWARIVATSFYCYGGTGQYRNGSATTTNSMDYYYMNMYNNYYSSYYNMMYGGYGGGYGYGYDPYDYMGYYMQQEMLNAQENMGENVSTTTVTTEIQSYTPLYFEVYIEE